MPAKAPPDLPVERRTEQRSPADRYYSVQFNVSGLKPQYQFKTWNISEKGLVIGFANEFQAVQGPSLISVR
jgi:hypothetical protein